LAEAADWSVSDEAIVDDGTGDDGTDDGGVCRLEAGGAVVATCGLTEGSVA
jgi:hypothetical protein